MVIISKTRPQTTSRLDLDIYRLCLVGDHRISMLETEAQPVGDNSMKPHQVKQVHQMLSVVGALVSQVKDVMKCHCQR